MVLVWLFRIFCISCFMWKFVMCMGILLFLNRVILRIEFMCFINWWLEIFMLFWYCDCLWDRCVLFKSVRLLRSLFKGVWILWFIMVRNLDFVFLLVKVRLCVLCSFFLVCMCFEILCKKVMMILLFSVWVFFSVSLIGNLELLVW